MNNNTNAIRVEQLDLMKHAIGMDAVKTKRGVYTAYRNRYITYQKCEPWEHLVKCGYATVYNEQPEGDALLQYVYSVTRAGMDFIERVLGIKIREDD